MNSTPAGPNAKRVLVVTNHQVLGKAIQAGLQHLLHVDQYDAAQEPALPDGAIGRYGLPDLIIITQLTRSSDPASARALASALDGYDRVPLLIISEQPTRSAPQDDLIHYMGFPFTLTDLQTRVIEILACSSDETVDTAAEENTTRIVIVEDEVTAAADLRAMLEDLDYRVVTKLSRAEDAVAIVRRDPPDLVLMDIDLAGELDGVQAAGIIHTEKGVPVIFLAASADRATLNRGSAAAPYGYILKPFDEREVDTVIQVALHRATDEYANRERWQQAVLGSIGDGVIVTDDDNRVVSLNPVAEHLTGQSQDQALGQRLEDLFPQSGWDTGVRAASRRTGEAHIVTPDNRRIILDYSQSPIEDEYTHQYGRILSFRDVTDGVRAYQQLQQRADELMAQNEELSAFAHTVAHDIKDPLNVVYGYSSVLADGEVELDGVTISESLQTIARYALRTCNIVDELLLLAQVRDADVETESLDMPTILDHAQQRLTDMCQRTGASISLISGMWPQAVGYGPWVEEIWVNLLSNGIKYGGQPPVLKLGARQEGDSVRFWVTDNGQGISEEEQQRLFVPYTRFQQVRATGQGLGLSIVQRIVNRLGGTVGVRSHRGEGSTFYFTLPAPGPTPTVVDPTQDSQPLRGESSSAMDQSLGYSAFLRAHSDATYRQLPQAQ